MIKAEVTAALHKSDVDAVRLGIGDAATAVEQYRQFEQRFGRSLRGVLVQSQQAAALELLIGALRDPTFGPLIVVGAGGLEAELRDDRVVLVAPVSRTAARRAIESLRLAPLFHGFHGRPELPVDDVVEFVHRLGLLAATTPEIQQLDLNPVVGQHNGLRGRGCPRRRGVASRRGGAGPWPPRSVAPGAGAPKANSGTSQHRFALSGVRDPGTTHQPTGTPRRRQRRQAAAGPAVHRATNTTSNVATVSMPTERAIDPLVARTTTASLRLDSRAHAGTASARSKLR